MYIIELRQLDRLLVVLQQRKFTTIGPTYRDGAIMLDEIHSSADLPVGYGDEQGPGTYSVAHSKRRSVFAYVVGPTHWKKFLYPPKQKLFSASKKGKGFEVEPERIDNARAYAFIGVRPCDLEAITIQDEIFAEGAYPDAYYSAVRAKTFIVAVNCTKPGGNCFCTSMGTGPKATRAFDLSLTEILDDGSHYFVVQVGSEAGQNILNDIEHREATRPEVELAVQTMSDASQSITKSLDTTNIARVMSENFEHPVWDDVAKRCLACANCTLVCPTCFCSTVEDVTDLDGSNAERWRKWDSCFTSEFTKIAGGNIRMSTRTRYRQWITHKLSYWHEQFGMLGCVGCGRCITWCPVGIDITREAAAIRGTSTQTTTA